MRSALGKASLREDTTPIKINQSRPPFWPQFHIFMFLHNKTAGLRLFYFAYRTKAASF